MNKRPISVTILSGLLIVAGTVGVAYHVTKFNRHEPFQFDLVWVCLVRLLAIIGGVFMLRGRDWARWLALAWLAYHVILSGFHSVHEAVMHALLLAVFAYFLFRRPAREWFEGRKVSGVE